MDVQPPPFRRDRLRELREAKGLGVEQLARLAGVSQSAITKAENGKAIPGSDTLAKLARALDTPMGYFYGEFPDLDPPQAAVRMSYDVFSSDPSFTPQQRERCQRAMGHRHAPRTAEGGRSLCEMVELVIGPPGSLGQLELVPKRKKK
jgi:transcriptional regulator with XRE-family HTH domain